MKGENPLCPIQKLMRNRLLRRFEDRNESNAIGRCAPSSLHNKKKLKRKNYSDGLITIPLYKLWSDCNDPVGHDPRHFLKGKLFTGL